MDIAKLINIITNNDIAIYGAGFVAEIFYEALQIRNIEKSVKCFVVTDVGKACGKIHGIPIKTIRDIIDEKSIFICVAVHEAIRDEIEEILLKKEIYNFVWIHPYIMDIAFGIPIERHKKMEVSKLIQNESDDNYALAVNCLAIDNYYKKNDIGYSLYLKTFSLHCEMMTAKKRLNNFINLIEDWDKNGYRQEKDILIDEINRRIEGTHRFSLACYHRMKYIYCDIYPYSNYYNRMMKEKGVLRMETLKKGNFDSHELKLIEQANQRIRKLNVNLY